MNCRAQATRVLCQVLQEQHSLSVLLQDNQNSDGLLRELCYGVLRYYWRLDAIAKKLLSKPLPPNHFEVHVLLLVGIYQLLYLNTPAHAAVHETVAAAHLLKKIWAKNLINACLRRLQREQDNLLKDIDNDVTAQYSHPLWFIKKLQQQWPEQWQAILIANNQIAPLTLRVNRLKISCVDYQQRLHEVGISAQNGLFSEDALLLDQHTLVSNLPEYNKGFFSVQDQAPQLCASLLRLQTGQRVLDACAAPGGKTTHLLETCPDLSEVVAIDSDLNRLKRLRENLARLNLSATVIHTDASQPMAWNKTPFDRILCDAPCSATGVIRRHPDIKWLRRANDIANLQKQQINILTNLWHVLKPGGYLLYATCSILTDENQDVIAQFLSQHADAKEVIIDAPWGVAMKHGRQILPGDANMDGFYFALLSKEPLT